MTRFVLPFSLLLLGCAGGEAKVGDEADELSSETGEQAAPFAPDSGEWVTVTNEVVSSTCELGEGDEPTADEPFTITDYGDGTFGLYSEPTMDDPGMDTTCTLTDQEFVCEDAAMPIEDLDGFDASLQMTQTITGSFAGQTEMSASADVIIECLGADCGVLADEGFDLPCTMIMEITAVLGA